MGLLDPEYTNRRPPDWEDPRYKNYWDRTPASDPLHPWVGILQNEREALNRTPLPEPPFGEDEHELQGYSHRLAPPMPGERAYHPTLRWEDSVPGMAEAQREAQRQLGAYDQDFTRQKTREEVGIPPLSTSEKLEIILRHYFPGLMGE